MINGAFLLRLAVAILLIAELNLLITSFLFDKEKTAKK
jgi:hypothetical protein